MEINVLVESTHLFFSNRPVNSLFLVVMTKKATFTNLFEYYSYVEGSLMLLHENKINTECVSVCACVFAILLGLRTFPVLFSISTYCRSDLVMLQPHPKHHRYCKLKKEKQPALWFLRWGHLGGMNQRITLPQMSALPLPSRLRQLLKAVSLTTPIKIIISTRPADVCKTLILKGSVLG